MDYSNEIKAITVGIRYERMFRAYDLLGNIIDLVLGKTKKSPFDRFKYNLVARDFDLGCRMESRNQQGIGYFIFNSDDIIFSFALEKSLTEEIDWLKKEVIKFIRSEIFTKYNIKYIKRYGIIYHHASEKNIVSSNILDLLSLHSVGDPHETQFRFTKRYDTTQAEVAKEVNDYINIISEYSVIQDKLRYDLDYQRIFVPEKADIIGCDLEMQTDNSLNFLKNDYYKWIEEFYEKCSTVKSSEKE